FHPAPTDKSYRFPPQSRETLTKACPRAKERLLLPCPESPLTHWQNHVQLRNGTRRAKPDSHRCPTGMARPETWRSALPEDSRPGKIDWPFLERYPLVAVLLREHPSRCRTQPSSRQSGHESEQSTPEVWDLPTEDQWRELLRQESLPSYRAGML